MKDLLLELSKNEQAKSLVKALGLPIPMPQELARATEPRKTEELAGRRIAFWSDETSSVAESIVDTVEDSGATITEIDPDEGTDARFEGLLLDATTLDTPSELRTLHDFFHPLMRQLERNGRVVVVGRPGDEAESAASASARRGLEGFIRSVGKEVGKRGSTAQLLIVEDGAEDNLAGPLRFVLSKRSVYVSGQPIRVSATAGTAAGDSWDRPLDGKTALVTGAARGIGAATAGILADEGADVICLDLPADEDEARSVARRIGGETLLADVTDEDTPAKIVERVTGDHGGLDVIVHNAGITRDKTLKNMTPDWWDQAVAVNLDAQVKITEHLADADVFNDGGRIICLSSISGIAGNVGQTNYSASKSGILGLVDYFSTTLADRQITANAIAPGFIETRLTEEMPVAVREVARRMNSLGQGGLPEDVGEAIAFLSTPGAQGVTGQVLRVCGGAMVGR